MNATEKQHTKFKPCQRHETQGSHSLGYKKCPYEAKTCHLQHCLANSRTFQDQDHFLELFRSSKFSNKISGLYRIFQEAWEPWTMLKMNTSQMWRFNKCWAFKLLQLCNSVNEIQQVAQLWQRDRTKLDIFSINVQRYYRNHAQNWIFGPPFGGNI